MVFSEREPTLYVHVRYMSSSVRLSVVRLSSVCNVRAPYSGDWNFRQCFYAILVRWPSADIQVKFYGDRPMGDPSVGGVKHKRGSRIYIVILDLSNAISRKRCKIWATIVLITNRTSHMSFQLEQNSVTLDNLKRHNDPNSCVISPNSVDFGRITYKWLKIHQYFLQRKCRPQNLVFISFMAISAGVTPNESVKGTRSR